MDAVDSLAGWLFFSTIHLFAVGTHPAPSEGESTVLRARQLPFDRRQVNFLVSEIVLRRSSLCSKYLFSLSAFTFSQTPDDYFYSENMTGNVADDPFVAYQGAAKVMSAKKRSSSRTISGDEVMITGSRRATVVKLEPSSSRQGKKP